MTPDRIVASIFALIMACWLAAPLLSRAGQEEAEGTAQAETPASRVPAPSIPRGQGENCVEEAGLMRRNHMHMLNHQRDETVLKGIRKEPYSLKECVNCHAVSGPDQIPVTVESPQHFCRSCHDYAAVNIDCFQCHASRPDIELAGK